MPGLPEAEPMSRTSTFDDFYRSSYPQTVRLAYALLGWTNSAEDIVQEAFSRVWEHFDSVENPGGFVRVTVVNLCRDAQRRQARERRPQVLVPEPPPVSGPAAELVDVLLQLPYRQRATLVLRYWAGFTEAEIADALGCRPGTVKTLAQRGLHRLRREVER